MLPIAVAENIRKMNETQLIEWKASWRDEYLQWLCGFANAQGGVLEVGRDDAGQVVGLGNAARLMEELPNKLRDLLGIVADIDLLQEDGRSYLRIAIEPYPVPISYRGEYHYRSGVYRNRCWKNWSRNYPEDYPRTDTRSPAR